MILSMRFNDDLFSDFFSDVSEGLDKHYSQTGVRPCKVQISKDFWQALLYSNYSLMRYSALTDTPLKRDSLTEEELTTLFHSLGFTEIDIVSSLR